MLYTPIIELLDDVDWEPLTLRFVPGVPVSSAEARRVATIITQWMERAQADPGEDRNITYWTLRRKKDGTITVVCEHIGEASVRALAAHVAANNPAYSRVLLGFQTTRNDPGAKIQWIRVPASSLEVDGNPVTVPAFQISKHHITIEQYYAFLDATGHVPVCEQRKKYCFRGSQIASGGRASGRWPVTHIAQSDATAYAAWVGGRLPTDAELYAFFTLCHQRTWKFNFGNQCWTQTRAAQNRVVVMQTPFPDQPMPLISELRETYPEDHFSFPFFSFRVVRGS